jgi:uncharacterized protein YfaS (alpha-2-macroglobulin family)
VDLTQLLKQGKNELALSSSGASGSLISVQAVAGYYVPWSESSNTNSAIRTGESHALALSVDFDKTQGRVGEKITCTVKVERIGGRGYGMLLGEIGLPPGAEVDRGSLDKAMQQAGWSIDHYDILPDRLVVYVWPSAGGSKFQFNFKPRFSEKAKSAPSVLYDYYNPDARTVLAPTLFLISE